MSLKQKYNWTQNKKHDSAKKKNQHLVFFILHAKLILFNSCFATFFHVEIRLHLKLFK